MAEVSKKNLSAPDEVQTFELGRAEIVTLGETTVGRTTLQPGWRWSQHIKPLAGTEWCQSLHVGVVLSGRMGILFADGTEREFGPDDVYVIAPEHDGYVIGDEPAVAIEWSGIKGWATALENLSQRVLATVLFTDIVDSTALAARMGDTRWQGALARHNTRVREALARFRGREVKTTGDGFLAAFDGAARAVRCAEELVRASEQDGLPIRAALHTGEVEVVGEDIRGLAVHEAARVLGLAGPSEVLVTAITRELATETGYDFEDRGEHELKGLAGPRRLYAIAPRR